MHALAFVFSTQFVLHMRGCLLLKKKMLNSIKMGFDCNKNTKDLNSEGTFLNY